MAAGERCGTPHVKLLLAVFAACAVQCKAASAEDADPPQAAILAAAAYLCLLFFNVVYVCNQRHPVSAPASIKPSKSSRLVRWDVVKFVLTYCAIFFHCTSYLFLPQDLPDELRSVMGLMRGWVLPSFVFVSGMFGTHLNPRSVAKVLSHNWINVILILVVQLIRMTLGEGTASSLHFNGYGYWYLWSLAAWRLTIIPVCSLFRDCLGLPAAVPVLLVFVASYILLHMTDTWYGMFAEDCWRGFLFFAPVFAVGSLQPPSVWANLFSTRRSALMALVYLTLWYLMLVYLLEFKTWNLAYCLDPATCDQQEFAIPRAALHAPVGLQSFLIDLTMMGLRLGIVISAVWALYLLATFLSWLLPCLAVLLGSFGSRALQASILHVALLQAVSMKANVQGAIHLVDLSWRFPLCALLALQFQIVLSSEGTAFLFAWLRWPSMLIDAVFDMLPSFDDDLEDCEA